MPLRLPVAESARRALSSSNPSSITCFARARCLFRGGAFGRKDEMEAEGSMVGSEESEQSEIPARDAFQLGGS